MKVATTTAPHGLLWSPSHRESLASDRRRTLHGSGHSVGLRRRLRWDTGEVIPGTEGITPGPEVRLVGWNTDDRNLRYADFSGGLDLTNAYFGSSWLMEADLGRLI